MTVFHTGSTLQYIPLTDLVVITKRKFAIGPVTTSFRVSPPPSGNSPCTASIDIAMLAQQGPTTSRKRSSHKTTRFQEISKQKTYLLVPT